MRDNVTNGNRGAGILLIAAIVAATAVVEPVCAEEGALTRLIGIGVRSSVEGATLLLKPDSPARTVKLGAVKGAHELTAVAVRWGEFSWDTWEQEGWVLVETNGIPGVSRGHRYAWVSLQEIHSEEIPRMEALHHRRKPRVVLHRAPERGEDPVMMFYLDTRTGSAVAIGRRDHESRVHDLLSETDVIVTSMGTGRENPVWIEITTLPGRDVVYSGYAWGVTDYIREGRYVRVMPWDSLKEAPGYVEDPPIEVLSRDPYRFSEEQRAEYRELRGAVSDPMHSVRVVPERWLDTLTGEFGEIRYSAYLYVEQ